MYIKLPSKLITVARSCAPEFHMRAKPNAKRHVFYKSVRLMQMQAIDGICSRPEGG